MQSGNDPATLARRLAELREEHRDLDAAIAKLAGDPDCNQFELSRLKKRKLKLKDMIAYFENKLIPDLDA
ncbi:MAG: YdcH family protein [Rhodanobacteraceae bacterium]